MMKERFRHMNASLASLQENALRIVKGKIAQSAVLITYATKRKLKQSGVPLAARSSARSAVIPVMGKFSVLTAI
jgi:hypothetical protein